MVAIILAPFLVVVSVVMLNRQDPVRDPLPPGGVTPLGLDGEQLNLGFERGTLESWETEGGAFAGQPILEERSAVESGQAGQYWLGSRERLGDGPTGSLTSAPFEITHPWAAFLLGGGSGSQTRVDLVLPAEDRVLASFSGQNYETLRSRVVDLSAHEGKLMRLRIVDEGSGSWGHINFDDFRFYDQRPEQGRSLDHETSSWASYRGNVGRTGYNARGLGDDLILAWRVRVAPPAPA